MINRIRTLLILCCVLQTPGAFADAPRQLMWEDLTPKLQASENPFSKLTKGALRHKMAFPEIFRLHRCGQLRCSIESVGHF
jgi:hypothetical protein